MWKGISIFGVEKERGEGEFKARVIGGREIYIEGEREREINTEEGE